MNMLFAGISAVLLYTASAAGVAPGQGDPFQQGIRLCQKKKYTECIHYLEKALNLYPEGSNIMWNLGLASASAQLHEKALTYWQRYYKLRPEDWRALPKLIQTYQALGRIRERDIWLNTLFELRQSAQGDEWKERPYFCREQFLVNGRLIMAFQYFEPVGERMKFYFFSVVGDDGKEQFYISLGSYDFTNKASREMGLLKENQRAYHLDGYYANGGHKTFGFLHRAKTPAYDEIRPVVVKILKGEIRPVSSSQFK